MVQHKNFRQGRSVVFLLHAHLVFVPKYRRGAIDKLVFETLRASWCEVCTKFEARLVEANWEPDHVHLLVEYPPKVALARLVNSLKGVSARRVRQRHTRHLSGKLWGHRFWSPSYCAVSCGGAPLGIIKHYIRTQKGNGASSLP